MKIAVTGTPGTGKTTATDRVTTDLDTIHLNEVIRQREFVAGRDEGRGTLVADMEDVSGWLQGREDVLVESHLAHHFDADRVVVLRCDPEVIETRLATRGEPESTIEENAESEALDLILAQAVDRHGNESVYEIDTTGTSPEAVAEAIEAVIDGRYEPSAGTVSFVEYL